MKRFIFLLIFLLLCLTACGSKNNGDEHFDNGNDFVEDADEAEQSNAVFDAKPAAAEYPLVSESTVLTVAYAAEPSMDYAAQEGTQDLLAAAQAATGVTLQLDMISASDWAAALNVQTASGEMDDLIFQAPDAMLSSEWNGALQPLNDLIEEYGPNYIRAANACYDGTAALSDEQGEIMQLYEFYDAPVFLPKLGIAIRQDWLDALGFDAPETYEDYHDLLLAIKNTYDPKLPFRMLPAGVTGGDNFTAGFGVSLGSGTPGGGFFQEDGVVKFGALEDDFASYVTMMHDWYEEGLITPAYQDPAELDSNSYLIDLSVGESGVFFLPLGSFSELEQMCDFPITPGMDPVEQAGDQTHLGPNRETSISSPGFSISSSCKDQKLAMQVADWFYSDEASLVGNWGEEGTTYTTQSGEPVYTDLILNNDQGLTPAAALTRYTSDWSGQVLLSRKQYFLQDTAEVTAVWAQQKDTDEMLPDGLTFTYEEGEELTAIMADINTYLDDAIAKLVSGDLPLSEIATVQETVRSMNIDSALALYQTTLDRYNA